MRRRADEMSERLLTFPGMRDELTATIYKDIVDTFSEPNKFLLSMKRRRK